MNRDVIASLFDENIQEIVEAAAKLLEKLNTNADVSEGKHTKVRAFNHCVKRVVIV